LLTTFSYDQEDMGKFPKNTLKYGLCKKSHRKDEPLTS
jgi:hypothetical protein